MKQAKRCFTLVEILMVTGIICLIAALILVSYNGIYRSWSTGNTIAAMKAAHLALDRYMLENGSYPESTPGSPPESASEETLQKVAGTDAKFVNDLLQSCSPYSEKNGNKVKIFDDFGKKEEIRYVFPVAGSNSFALISYGKDGDDRTDDDIIYLPGGTSSLKPGFYMGTTTAAGGVSDPEPLGN